MKCIIKGKLFEGSANACFDLMAKLNRYELKQSGLWWEEDEIKYNKRRK